MTKKRKPLIALILSLFFPSSGQLYNGELLKGIIVLLSYIIIPIMLIYAKVPDTFLGLLISLLLSISIYIGSVIDAVVTSFRKKEITLKSYNRWYFYAGVYTLTVILFTLPFIFSDTAAKKLARYQSYRIAAGSMNPTLIAGEEVFTAQYAGGKAERGGLVAYIHPAEKEEMLIHRCVAVENDSVEIKDGSLFVNGVKESGDYFRGETLNSRFGREREAYTVPTGTVFILGDNRENAADSRLYGFVSMDNVLAKVLYIYYSQDFSRIGKRVR